jgi:DNA-binding IclR family transcriptional regulator
MVSEVRLVYILDHNSAMPNSRRPTTIQSVDRAAAILKALAGGPGRLGVSELADRLDLARPTVHGLLQTLLAQGFVEQDRDSEKYQLGAGLLQLGYSYLDVNELRSRSITYAAQLAVRTKFAVRVGVMHGPSAVVVHHVFRPDATLQILEVGSQLPLHASALGKALLAFAPAGVIDNLMSAPLERLTKRTSNAAALRLQLNTIRLQAIATERDEAVLGESSIAAPIFDRSSNAVGAIAVVGDTDRVFPRGTARGLSTAVVEAARGVSRELGAPRWPFAG